ncbi:MAG: phosphatidylinositol-specific phospholipase C domain-containing protein, partial [Faecalicoccus sp.]|nr:phosphatidylinositol-specific phospholipase C domain-containing protein [Faecalicoccus sp.]
MHPKFTKSIAFLSMFTAMMFFGTDTIAASESENIPTETPTQEILASQTNEETGDVHNDEVNVDEIDISEKNDEKTDAEEQGNGNVQDAETLNEQEAEIEATDTVQADIEESTEQGEALSASNAQDDSSSEFPGIKNLDSDWDQNWMSRLPDGAKINELSIPGAHDAAAHNVAGLDITGPLKAYVARTQDKYISELLETGTRYFDLRIDKTDDGDLGLCHGFMELYDKNNQRLKLDSVINDMRSFLTNHSGEALILQIKCDHDNCDAEIHEYFKSLVDEYPDLIYCGDHVPTLGEARGKMLIFSRLKLIGGVEGESETVAEYSRRRQGLYKMDDGTYWALEISSFNGGDSKTYSMAKTAEFGTSEVWTEDMYDVPRYRKNIYVNYSLLDHGNPPENNYAERVKQEAREKGVDAWSIIYSSMSYQNWASIVKDILLLPFYDDGSLARDMDWPIDGAQYMNPVLKELIASIPDLYTGCLVGDFYDSELLRQIYGSNFLRRNKDPWNSYYEVKFNSQGGSPVDSQQVFYDDKAAQPEDPVRDKYAFVGWYKDASGTEAYDFDTPVTTNITLFANWIEKFTVTFDANGHGTAPSAQTINHGDKAVQPEALTEEGWTFVGWFKDASGSEAYDFATPVTADITLFANWTENEYTVTFDANGHGTAPSAQTIKHGDKAAEPEALTEEGWTFGGWFKDASGT